MKALVLAVLLLVGCGAYIGGEDIAVRRYLRENLHDPMSLQVLDWGEKVPVKDNPTASYVRTVRYRAKNKFGAYVIETCRFYVYELAEVVTEHKIVE